MMTAETEIKSVDKRFSRSSRELIEKANDIIDEYKKQGYDLTLRQLYYQFVSRGWIDNKDKEYKRLGSVVADARLAGLIDWLAITDRTRNLRSNSHWEDPAEIIRACASSYANDKWKNQNKRPEVWVEKDALIGVIEQACQPLDISYFSCRGYTSISEVWGASERLKKYEDMGQIPVIFHLGDHDPSGIDMSRDIQERLETFGVNVEFHRLALNMDQVDEIQPDPPNPAKVTDSRFEGYQKIHGDDSWELDALDPATLSRLIENEANKIMDIDLWNDKVAAEEKDRALLTKASTKWNSIVKRL